MTKQQRIRLVRQEYEYPWNPLKQAVRVQDEEDCRCPRLLAVLPLKLSVVWRPPALVADHPVHALHLRDGLSGQEIERHVALQVKGLSTTVGGSFDDLHRREQHEAQERMRQAKEEEERKLKEEAIKEEDKVVEESKQEPKTEAAEQKPDEQDQVKVEPMNIDAPPAIAVESKEVQPPAVDRQEEDKPEPPTPMDVDKEPDTPSAAVKVDTVKTEADTVSPMPVTSNETEDKPKSGPEPEKQVATETKQPEDASPDTPAPRSDSAPTNQGMKDEIEAVSEVIKQEEVKSTEEETIQPEASVIPAPVESKPEAVPSLPTEDTSIVPIPEETKSEVVENTKVPNVPSSLATFKAGMLLDEDRYWSLSNKETQIAHFRRQALSRRQRVAAAKAKKRKTEKTVMIQSLTAWREHGPFKAPELTEDEMEDWKYQQQEANDQVMVWLEFFRRARWRYWREQEKEPQIKYFGQIEAKTKTEISSGCKVCTEGPVSSLWPNTCVKCEGDDLMQCLECGLVGCAPKDVVSVDSSEHMLQHYLETNHALAVTCGKQTKVYSFHCEDFVKHIVFETERKRLDLKKNLEWLSWKEHSLIRSFDAFRFKVDPENGAVWQGVYAAYPSTVPEAHVSGAFSSLYRHKLFHGLDTDEEGTLSELKGLFDNSGKWLVDDRCTTLTKAGSKSHQPVGLHNMGNTCFMSSVVQCLIASNDVRRFFLDNVRHNHVACEKFRNHEKTVANSLESEESAGKDGSNKTATGSSANGERDTGCLACEIDKVLLRYLGSSHGVNLLRAIESNAAGSLDSSVTSSYASARGEPLVCAELLATAWKCVGMSHLAGYDQRDAHEFFHGFLDGIHKYDLEYQKRIHKALDISGTREMRPQQPDFNKVFEGTLQSVLVCSKCGNKRFQKESFTTISLPLSKEVSRLGITHGSPGRARRLTVELCLEHFTGPEILSDPVDCPVCKQKTPTKKQHVISSLPKVLCLHLKRFDAAQNKKIEDFVSFPARGLEMGKYLPHWREVPRVDDKATDEGGPPPLVSYNLFATVNHTGNLQSGHYIANIKSGDNWYHCNDAQVHDITEEKVMFSQGAYMLFYCR